MNFKCNCENIEIWSYDRQTSVLAPFKIKNCLWDYKDFIKTFNWLVWTWISIDTCLVQEIAELWKKWIRTTWCCCWHNKAIPFIWVEFEDIQKMKDLWYKVQENPCRPWDEDSFYPKSLNSINVNLEVDVINIKELAELLNFTHETAIWFIKKVDEWRAKSKETYKRMLHIKEMIEKIK